LNPKSNQIKKQINFKSKQMKKQINPQHEQQASNLEASITCTIIILICLFGNQILDKLFF
jgi:hypothetical protein